MKRYLLFLGSEYYPSGGWNDFQGDFDTIKEAEIVAEKEGDDWFQIIDTKTKKEILSYKRDWF